MFTSKLGLMLSLLLLALNARALPPDLKSGSELCGKYSDIVFMIDLTSSIAGDELSVQKNAVKHLLSTFAAAEIKPRVAIGTFNIRPTSRARIVKTGDFTANLTDNYGQDGSPGTRLYAALNSITATSGRTDISSAIDVAQAELAANAYSAHRFIIFVTDGKSDEPGCSGSCVCEASRAAAMASADAAEAAGDLIFAVRYNDPNDQVCLEQQTVNFMRNDLASIPAYFYQSLPDGSNLGAIFLQIATILDCNDQDSCTSDYCNPNTNLCEYTTIDGDADGTPDCRDACPSDPLKGDPGQCGCGAPDTDGDQDGIADCKDACPNDPHKSAPGACGCGLADIDSDGDGALDCHDHCPNSPIKTEPGVCGCDTPDTDSDKDGAPDCIDRCPNDPTKVDDIDSDGNGILDCVQCTIVDVTTDRGDLKIGPERLVSYANKSLKILIRNANKTDPALGLRLTKSGKRLNLKLRALIKKATQSLDQLPDNMKICSDNMFCSSVDNTAAIAIYRNAVLELAAAILRSNNRGTRLTEPSLEAARKLTAPFGANIRGTRDQLLAKANALPPRRSFCTD
jgi:hypothetical protein